MVGRVLAVVVAAVTALAVAPATADAAEGISLSSENVVRVDPERPAVVVESTYRMTNVKPNKQLGGGRYEYYFFTGLTVPLLPGASEVTVEINGRDGDFTIEDDEGFAFLDIRLGYELRYQKTATIVVRSVLLGDPPRADSSWVRVNPAYASFEAWGWGDDGQVDVRIEVPAGWTPEWVGGDLTRRTEDGLQVFEAVDIDDAFEWAVLFTARYDDLLDSSRLTVGDADFEIRSWPGDVAWLEFANDQIAAGVPVLEELLGTTWPVGTTTEVIEASTPYLTGYAGFYDSVGDVIEIGEDLDRDVFLHELAHAWINGDDFADRWIIEGIAEEIASRAVEQLGDELPVPLTDADLRREGVEFDPFPLTAWSRYAPSTDGSEDYGYAASFRVMRALGDEVGDEAMTELLRAMLAGERSYPGEDGPEQRVDLVDWREFLDLAEQLTTTTGLRATYRELVLTDSQLDQLDRRNEAVAEYEALLERSGTWFPPAVVRQRLAAWQIDRALDAIEDAELTLDRRDDLWDTLAPLGLTSPSSVEQAYQDAGGDLDDVRDRLVELTGDAARLVAVRDELTAVLGEVDQAVPELTQADYEEDPAGAVDAADELVDDAEALVATMAELHDVLDEHALAVPPLDPNAFAVDRAGAQQLLDEQVATATVVDATHDDRDAATSLLQRVGLWRTDVDRDLARLDALLADGDNVTATRLAAQIRDDIDELAASGARRLGVAGGALALLLLVGAAIVVARRRRSGRDGTSTIETIDDAAPPEELPAPDGPPAEPSAEPAEPATESGDGAPDLAARGTDAGQAGAVDPDR